MAYKTGHRDARHAAAELSIPVTDELNDLKDRLNEINNMIFAQGLSLGSADYFVVRSLCTEGNDRLSRPKKADPIYYEINLIVDQNIVIQHCLNTLWEDLIVTSSDPRIEVMEMKGARDRVGAIIGIDNKKIDTTIRIEVKQ